MRNYEKTLGPNRIPRVLTVLYCLCLAFSTVAVAADSVAGGDAGAETRHMDHSDHQAAAQPEAIGKGNFRIVLETRAEKNSQWLLAVQAASQRCMRHLSGAALEAARLRHATLEELPVIKREMIVSDGDSTYRRTELIQYSSHPAINNDCRVVLGTDLTVEVWRAHHYQKTQVQADGRVLFDYPAPIQHDIEAVAIEKSFPVRETGVDYPLRCTTGVARAHVLRCVYDGEAGSTLRDGFGTPIVIYGRSRLAMHHGASIEVMTQPVQIEFEPNLDDTQFDWQRAPD